ncbi:hypothetical protein BJ912DRAFT_1069478 [Pholiota molesta]|nr:hypothetical protein BJ912DRAFT_1069478 [Pholiota molesta]
MENLDYGQFTTITYDAEDQRRLLSYIPDSQPELIWAIQLQFNIDAHGINTLREYERVKRMLENTRREYERVKQMASDNYDYLLSMLIPEFTAPFFYTPLPLDSPPYNPGHNSVLPEEEEHFETPPESPEPGSPLPNTPIPINREVIVISDSDSDSEPEDPNITPSPSMPSLIHSPTSTVVDNREHQTIFIRDLFPWESPEMQELNDELTHDSNDASIATKKGIFDVTVLFDSPDDDPPRSNPEASRLNQR